MSTTYYQRESGTGSEGEQVETTNAEDVKGKKKKGGKKRKRSNVWKHFTEDDKIAHKANCHYCGKKMAYKSSNGTSAMRKHLVICMQHRAWKAAQGSNQKVVEADSEGVHLAKVSERVFREACNEMLVLGELPLSFIDGLAFRHFCHKMKLYRPYSRRTATRNIVEMYAKRKLMMKKILGGNKQRLSLTTDIWVAPNTGASYMVITAHFIDSNWQFKKLIIGFKNISDHKGATISAVLMEVLDEWDIKKIFSITVDNATANSNALVTFKEGFSQIGEDSLVLNGEFLHIRCATHILNLIVRDGMQEVDKSVSAIRNAIQYVRSSGPRENSFAKRVDQGKVKRGSLTLDCKTRWNSTFLMLNRAMDFRGAFDKMKALDRDYVTYFKDSSSAKNVDPGKTSEPTKKRYGPPGKDDWDAVDRLLNFLVLFYESTLVLSETNKVNSYKLYNEIVSIQTSIMEMGSENEFDMEVQTKVHSMMAKLGKYWDPFNEDTEMNNMVIVASVFVPRHKMKFAQLCFNDLYGKDSVKATAMQETTMMTLKRLFDEYNRRSTSQKKPKARAGSSSSQSQGSGSSPSSQPAKHSGKVDFSARLGARRRRMDTKYQELADVSGIQETITELELYLAENVENPHIFSGTEYDVLSWWKANSLKFPVLSEVAKDVLAMQVSSVASESAFSTSGRILDPYRSCLTHYTIEVLMCLEQWLKTEIRIDNKGSITIEQLLEDIEDQDELQREFGEFNLDENE